MDLKATAHDTRPQDEREWELSDEELDRSADNVTRGSSLCSTSRPCSCSRCHCR